MKLSALRHPTPKQKSIGLCVIVGLAVFLLGFVMLIKPRMDKPGQINSEADGVRGQVQTETLKLQALQKKAKLLPQEKHIARQVERKFPSTADQNALLAQLQTAAAKAGLNWSAVSGLTLGVPTVQVGSSSGISVPGDPSTATAPTDSTSAAATTPASTDTTSTSTTTTDSTSGQVATMDVTMTVTAPQRKFQAFLKALEGSPRAFLVNSVSLTGDTGQSSIDGTMFIIPGPSSTPSAPAATPSSAVPSSAPTS